jgi:hypothetical protein
VNFSFDACYTIYGVHSTDDDGRVVDNHATPATTSSMGRNNDPENRWKGSSRRYEITQQLCGLYIGVIGFLSILSLAYTLYSPNKALTLILGSPNTALGKLAPNSFAQLAVILALIGYYDVITARTMITVNQAKSPIPRDVIIWNNHRVIASFLWMLKIAHGLFHMTLNKSIAPNPSKISLAIMCVLIVDALIVRPISISTQMAWNDAFPQPRFRQIMEFESSSNFQRLFQSFSSLEGLVLAFAGASYFLCPELLFYCIGYPVTDSDPVTLWCLSQFGLLSMCAGLYHFLCPAVGGIWGTASRLCCSVLWAGLFWTSVSSRLGQWNPLLFSGGNLFCNILWLAVSMGCVCRVALLLSASVSVSVGSVSSPSLAAAAAAVAGGKENKAK